MSNILVEVEDTFNEGEEIVFENDIPKTIGDIVDAVENILVLKGV